jgi:hypothetical protein
VFSCSSNAEAISEGITLFANVPVASGPSHRAKLQRSHLVSAIVVDETFPLNNCQQNITVATVLSVLYCTTENIIISVQYFSLPVLVSVLSSLGYSISGSLVGPPRPSRRATCEGSLPGCRIAQKRQSRLYLFLSTRDGMASYILHGGSGRLYLSHSIQPHWWELWPRE